MDDLKHISQTDLNNFQYDLMGAKEKIKFLEHISTCDFCSEQFTDFIKPLTAPPDMKANILKAVKHPEVQFAQKVNETSKQMQLFWYSLKVGTAMIGALAVLILSMNFGNHLTDVKDIQTDIPKESNVSEVERISLTSVIKENMDFLSNSISDFSNNIIKSEVKDHDQKEK